MCTDADDVTFFVVNNIHAVRPLNNTHVYRMSSSSSSSDRPVRRGRGRGRAARGGQVRGGVRTRGTRSATAVSDRATIALDIVQTRKERMKTHIAEMSESRMRDVLLELVEVQPSLIFSVMEPVPRQPGGYHPPSDVSSPDWCVCQKCRDMPTEWEKVCCEQNNCITLVPDFQVLILDEGVLALARLYRQDILVFEEGADIRKANRHAAYSLCCGIMGASGQETVWLYHHAVCG